MWRVFVAMYGLLLLLSMGSRAWARFLRRSGLAGLQHVESSRSRVRTHVPCVGRQILNHCATREVRMLCLLTNTLSAYYFYLQYLLYILSFKRKKKLALP